MDVKRRLEIINENLEEQDKYLFYKKTDVKELERQKKHWLKQREKLIRQFLKPEPDKHQRFLDRVLKKIKTAGSFGIQETDLKRECKILRKDLSRILEEIVIHKGEEIIQCGGRISSPPYFQTKIP